MPLHNRIRNAGRWFTIAACLVATYLIFAVTAMRVALRVSEMPAPDLRSRTVAEATVLLQEQGLALSVDESGRLDPTTLISHRLPLGDGRRAYELFDQREDGCVKVVLRP